jgi:hypothetical protein
MEDGQRVLVHRDRPYDEPDNDAPRLPPVWTAGLNFLTGRDPRTIREIAESVGVSKQRLSFVIDQIRDRIQLPHSQAKRRPKRKAAAPGIEDDGKSLFQASEDCQ